MKKVLSMFLAAVMLLSIAACSSKTDAPETTPAPTETNGAGESESTLPEDSTSSGSSDTEGDEGQTSSTTAEGSSAAGQTKTDATKKPSTAKPKPTTAKPKPTTAKPGETTKPADKAQSLSDLMELVYTDYEKPMVKNEKITAENSEFYLGVKELKCEDAIASEAMIGSIAHSVCLVRVADGADVDQLKKDIKKNVNSYKWVCVGVEPENVIVDSVGNTIILILDNFDRDLLHDNFLKYAK